MGNLVGLLLPWRLELLRMELAQEEEEEEAETEAEGDAKEGPAAECNVRYTFLHNKNQ